MPILITHKKSLFAPSMTFPNSDAFNISLVQIILLLKYKYPDFEFDKEVFGSSSSTNDSSNDSSSNSTSRQCSSYFSQTHLQEVFDSEVVPQFKATYIGGEKISFALSLAADLLWLCNRFKDECVINEMGEVLAKDSGIAHWICYH